MPRRYGHLVFPNIEDVDLFGVDAGEVLDDLVIDTSNPQVLESIDSGRAEAIKAWVRAGGHLVIVAGAQRPRQQRSDEKSVAL